MLRQNVALDQRLAVMRKYITFALTILVRCCFLRYLLLFTSNMSTMSTVVYRISSVDTVTVTTVTSVDTVTAISIVVMNTISVTEKII